MPMIFSNTPSPTSWAIHCVTKKTRRKPTELQECCKKRSPSPVSLSWRQRTAPGNDDREGCRTVEPKRRCAKGSLYSPREPSAFSSTAAPANVRGTDGMLSSHEVARRPAMAVRNQIGRIRAGQLTPYAVDCTLEMRQLGWAHFAGKGL